MFKGWTESDESESGQLQNNSILGRIDPTQIFMYN